MYQNFTKLLFHLKQSNIAGYIITSYDQYLSEYVQDHRNYLKIITNFTGSNGLAIILRDKKSLFFTDGRYMLQAKKELLSQIFEIYDINSIRTFNWSEYLDLNRDILGINPELCDRYIISLFQNVQIKFLTNNFLLQFLERQYSKTPPVEIFEYPERYAGESYKSKLERIIKYIQQKSFQNMLFTNSENISWLLNLRSWDLEFTPTMLSALLMNRNMVYLFLDENLSLSQQIMQSRSEIQFNSMSQLYGILQELQEPCLYDKDSNCRIIEIMNQSEHNRAIEDPITLWKLHKHDSEIEHAISINKIDSIAICEFLAFVDDKVQNNEIYKYSEYDLILELNKIRAAHSKFIKNSFYPICGFGPNSSVIHYKAVRNNSLKIDTSGVLLIDSGGQYFGGTTDLTRTIAIGEVTDRYSYFYTKILKSHIAISSLIFPASKITGSHIDSFARREIWRDFLDFPHSTGHGVGNFLNVHELPLSISSYIQNKIFFEKNMIISNEPGIYFDDEFGIRIENLIVTRLAQNDQFLTFQNLTLVPYEKKLIKYNLLDKQDLEYLDSYYKILMQDIYPELSYKAQRWLQDQINI